MTKFRFVSIIAIGLLVANIALISFLFLNRPGRQPHGGPKREIEEHLHFNEKQIADYEKLIRVHHANIVSKDSLIRLTKNALYTSIAKQDEKVKDSLITKLGHMQMEVEEIHYRHFQDIRSLCHPDQIAKFNELMNDLAELFGGPKEGTRR